MSYIILASITLLVVSCYNSISKKAGYSKMIDDISPSWNISINIL